METVAQWAWFSGLFEGEGCIKFRGLNSVVLSVTSTDLDVLERIQRIFGGGIGQPKFRPLSTKPVWTWNCGRRNDVISIINGILPYMLSRRAKKLEDALQRLENCSVYSRREATMVGV